MFSIERDNYYLLFEYSHSSRMMSIHHSCSTKFKFMFMPIYKFSIKKCYVGSNKHWFDGTEQVTDPKMVHKLYYYWREMTREFNTNLELNKFYPNH